MLQTSHLRSQLLTRHNSYRRLRHTAAAGPSRQRWIPSCLDIRLSKRKESRILSGEDRACVAFNAVQTFGKRLAALPQLAHLSEKIDLAAGRQGEERIYGCRVRRTGRLTTGFLSVAPALDLLQQLVAVTSDHPLREARHSINLLRQSLIHDVLSDGSLNRAFAP